MSSNTGNVMIYSVYRRLEMLGGGKPQPQRFTGEAEFVVERMEWMSLTCTTRAPWLLCEGDPEGPPGWQLNPDRRDGNKHTLEGLISCARLCVAVIPLQKTRSASWPAPLHQGRRAAH